MQPRQRSKCPTTVGSSPIVPSSFASISWIRPRGESISSCQRTYVGHVGRQKPQCTQSRVSSRSIGEDSPSGRSCAWTRSLQRAHERRGGSPSRRGCGHVGDAGGGAHDGLGEPASVARAGPGRSGPAPAPRPGAPRLVPDPASASLAADERARRRPGRRRRASRALEQHRDAPGVEHVERARLQLRARSGATTRAGVVGLRDDGSRDARGTRVQAEATRADQRRGVPRAADELAEVVAGDVLHHLAARARDRAVARARA